jgi:sensor domain CHASE-containing protein
MEQERIIILISTLVVLIAVIAMVLLFSVFQYKKNKLLEDNDTLRKVIKNKLSIYKEES